MTTIPAARSTPFIETFPTRRWKGHAALVWIAGRVYAAFFGPTLTAVFSFLCAGLFGVFVLRPGCAR